MVGEGRGERGGWGGDRGGAESKIGEERGGTE